MRALCILALAALTACAADICDKRTQIAAECGMDFSDGDLGTCREAYDSCSRDEKADLKKLYLCLEKEGYEDCSEGATGSGPSFEQIDAFLACEDDADKISDSCLISVGVGVGTTFTPTF